MDVITLVPLMFRYVIKKITETLAMYSLQFCVYFFFFLLSMAPDVRTLIVIYFGNQNIIYDSFTRWNPCYQESSLTVHFQF